MQSNKITHQQVYGDAGLIYIQAPAKYETKANGQKKIKGSPFPTHASITTQPKYGPNAGNYYTLKMGTEFEPGRWAILLDFDNKEEGGVRNGLDLVKKLDLNQYSAPKQLTPSKGCHCIFYLDAKQAEQMTRNSINNITYQGEQYAMDVKFKNQLCNCWPSQIPDYGKYAWTKGSFERLKNIPQLPDVIFDLIKSPATTPSTRTPATTPPDTPRETPTATEEQMKEINDLCSCLSDAQLDNRDSWIKIGRILKQLGAPWTLWDEISKRSNKYKPGECAQVWKGLKSTLFTIRSLKKLAEMGDPKKHSQLDDPFTDDEPYQKVETVVVPAVEIDTPFLTPETETTPKTPDQETFQRLTDETIDDPTKKSLVVKSRYGSGKTTFLKRLIKAKNPKRVLFITYRQTLARDIMRNFGPLGFKNYLDAHENPSVWTAPRLIVQLDSLMHIWRNSSGLKRYDMIILDESESLLSHLDGGTMRNKGIQIFNFFNGMLSQCGKILFMDGDIGERSLSFARNYGDLTYIENKNIEGKKVINLFLDEEQWKQQLRTDLEKYHAEDPRFRVCIVSQSASQIDALSTEIGETFSNLVVKKLTGNDGGQTEREYLDDINETLLDTNVFLYSPVIEAGVDITIPVKKVYGILSANSNSQRAFMQMINRCRRVEEPRMDFLKGEGLDMNNNYNFWTFNEIMHLNRHTVDATRAEFVVDENGDLQLKENALNKQRKTISIYNTVEEKNKHPSLFINYLRVLVASKGIKFEVQARPEEQEGAKKKKKKGKKNAKIEQILSAKDLDEEEFEELSLRKKRATRQQRKITKQKNIIGRSFFRPKTSRRKS